MTFGKISSPSSSVFGSPSSFTFPDAIFTVQTPLHIVGAMLYELIAVVCFQTILFNELYYIH